MSNPISRNGRIKRETSANVLVVDDEAFVRDLLARWLTDEGYVCAQAPNAQAAWEHLQVSDVHVVTLDIRMPGRSGIDLLGTIRDTYPDRAVIMMTAVGETKTAIDALTHGAWGYLIKPVEREELLFQMSRALERRQLLIEKRQYTHRLEERVREQTLTIRRAHEETIHRLVGASMYRDEETGAHIKRTGLFSEVLVKAAGWSSAEAEMLRMAAPMHDVGKIGIPDAILQKPGKLTREEFEIMKTHTVIGADMLAGSDVLMLQMARDIALGHHERWDGGGYPNGLAGSDIPETARIVAIVDVYDALTHDRVYRPALPEEEALDIMQKGVGTQFDPVLSTLFLSLLPEISQIAEENPDEALEAHASTTAVQLQWPNQCVVQTIQTI
jgi:putative two-component system response regulator